MFRFLSISSRRHALVLVPLLLVVVAGGGIFWYSYATANASPNTADTSSGNVADASGNDAQSGTQILLGLARNAMHDGRLVAPAGSNAYEFYLSVLQLEPQNRGAQEALRESFPRASEEIERTINQDDLDEARREIDLLREFDSTNFTLALLGGKLSAARNIETKRHEAEAERIQQANAGHATPGM
ncbi:energy transducer TonB [Rhodanobacter sp. C01]|uniref:energy transducer TonB n=1 Tax=Rhodanobacter sp. C01 TaxID=1945856 RepID=UPI0009870639|nr:energy transducer TonB [Rhodanobacter sp. C01]OOG49841.1 energy transducer TonB [Rhodanobacter sp. C01]